MQKAKIDAWVGTKLITAYDQPALGAVYKIVAIEDETGELRNTIVRPIMLKKVSTQARKGLAYYVAAKKGSPRETILPMTAF